LHLTASVPYWSIEEVPSFRAAARTVHAQVATRLSAPPSTSAIVTHSDVQQQPCPPSYPDRPIRMPSWPPCIPLSSAFSRSRFFFVMANAPPSMLASQIPAWRPSGPIVPPFATCAPPSSTRPPLPPPRA